MHAAPTTAVQPPPQPPGFNGVQPRPRSLDFALFLGAVLWYQCAQSISTSSANGFDRIFDLAVAYPLVQAVLLLFLMLCGLALLRTIERRSAPLWQTIGLPPRATSRAEWARGAAIGWALAVAAVLPMALERALSIQFWTQPRAFLLLAIGMLTLALLTLAHTLAIYGYGFQRLIDATGPTRATLIVVAVVTVVHAVVPVPYGTPEGTRILVDMLMTLLLCLCWLRTHAVWLAWGLHFAWAAAIAVLFGLPIVGQVSFGSVVDTRAVGPAWLTGGEYGPAAALLMIFFLLAAIPVLVRTTEDYAWNYTHPPLVPGGYDVTVAAPAAHVAMEQAAQPGSLVQIAPVAPQNASTDNSSE